MSDIPDYFEPTPGFLVFAPFRPVKARCLCGRAFRQKQRNHSTCGRPECQREHSRRLMAIRNAKRRGTKVDLTRKRKRCPRGRADRSEGPPLVQGSAPLCCGEAPHFDTDRLGRTVVICRVCGERPQELVRATGQELYPQRRVLDDEIDAHVATAKAPIPQTVSALVGDAFRQDTHKRGAA